MPLILANKLANMNTLFGFLLALTSFNNFTVYQTDFFLQEPKYERSMNKNNDSLMLSAVNARFIKNFITQDVNAHDKIIHKDFVCIESNGSIVSRETYLKNWATAYNKSGCISFTYRDECIRIFGDIALVRSKTTAVRKVDDKIVTGHTIYTDTYKKENGVWKCIQVQITPLR
jgi:ketosteroid isomerase-like protein